MKVVPVNDRRYVLVSNPSTPVKGKQRQIVLSVLNEQKRPMTVEEMTPLCEEKGLTAVGGVGPSVRYHLHHLTLLGHTTWEGGVDEKKVA